MDSVERTNIKSAGRESIFSIGREIQFSTIIKLPYIPTRLRKTN